MTIPADIRRLLEENPDAALAALLDALSRRTKANRLDAYDPSGVTNGRPHQKQMDFHRLGASKMFRLLAGGNRTGKTVAGCAEDAYHLTGRYPQWWEGRVFQHPTRGWVASETDEVTRDVDQLLLLGEPDAIGTGLIPKEDILDVTRKNGVPDAIDKVYVRNRYGGTSTLQFKSYASGRKKFQGTSKHFVHLDEEPEISIYFECQQRILDVGGILYMTMTPLQGMTDTCMQFYGDQLVASPARARIDMTWADNPWLPVDEVALMERDVPPHELEARRDGRPQLGSGRIYPFARGQVECEPFEIPASWPRGIGLDFGWNWTAAVWMAFDEEGDTLYIYDTYKVGGISPAVHTSAIKRRGPLPVFGDPSGWKQVGDAKTGKKVIELWNEVPDPLDIKQADNAVSAGILDCYDRFETGRLKVFRTCRNWFDEFDIYQRDEKGKVVKKNDHLMDATRYAVRSHGKFMLPRQYMRRGLLVTSNLHHNPASDMGY